MPAAKCFSTLIDLATAHKRGLTLNSPLLNAAGTLGFAAEYAGLIDFAQLGAFVTNPLTHRPRTPARGEHVREFDGGLLVHTGLPNPGIREAVRQHARAWARMPCPVIVHVAATTPDEVAHCVERLEEVENVAGVELGLPGNIEVDEAANLTAAATQGGSLPVIVRPPLLEAERLAEAVIRAGAQALTAGGPPRGTLPNTTGGWLTGRLYSPALYPLALRTVQALANKQLAPIIAASGIQDLPSAQAMLDAGAVAIQVDAAVWRDPSLVGRMAEGLEIRDWRSGVRVES